MYIHSPIFTQDQFTYPPTDLFLLAVVTLVRSHQFTSLPANYNSVGMDNYHSSDMFQRNDTKADDKLCITTSASADSSKGQEKIEMEA